MSIRCRCCNCTRYQYLQEGRFHSLFSVLAVCNGMSGNPLHPLHFSHSAARVFDEIERRFQLSNEFQHMFINLVTEFRIFRNRIKIAGFRVLSPVLADCHNTERRAIGRGPDNIRLAEFLNEFHGLIGILEKERCRSRKDNERHSGRY